MKKKARPKGMRNPKRTRQSILDAACRAFAQKGFEGSRVDEIARDACANKRMIYHYFGDKDGLFSAVLEDLYQGIGRQLDSITDAEKFKGLDPDEALRAITEGICRYFAERPDVISIVNTANVYGARHVAHSPDARGAMRPLEVFLGKILREGATLGLFRPDVPVRDLLMSIFGLAYVFNANTSSLSVALGRSLGCSACADAWYRHIANSVARFVAAESKS